MTEEIIKKYGQRISDRLQMLLKSVPPDIAQKIDDRAKNKAEKCRKGHTLIIP